MYASYVHPKCNYILCAYILHPTCAYILCVYNLHTTCAYILCAYILHPTCACDRPWENQPSLHLGMIVEIHVLRFVISITSFCLC